MNKVSVQLTPGQVASILDCFASHIRSDNAAAPGKKSPAEIAAWWKTTGRFQAKKIRGPVHFGTEAAAIIEALSDAAPAPKASQVDQGGESLAIARLEYRVEVMREALAIATSYLSRAVAADLEHKMKRLGGKTQPLSAPSKSSSMESLAQKPAADFFR